MPSSPEVGSQTVAVTNSINTTGKILKPCRGMQVHIPSGSGLTTLTWHSLAPIAGTKHPAKTEADLSVAVVQTGFSAGDSFPMPSDLFACAAVYPVGNTSGNIEVTQMG